MDTRRPTTAVPPNARPRRERRRKLFPRRLCSGRGLSRFSAKGPTTPQWADRKDGTVPLAKPAAQGGQPQ